MADSLDRRILAQLLRIFLRSRQGKSSTRTRQGASGHSRTRAFALHVAKPQSTCCQSKAWPALLRADSVQGEEPLARTRQGASGHSRTRAFALHVAKPQSTCCQSKAWPALLRADSVQGQLDRKILSLLPALTYSSLRPNTGRVTPDAEITWSNKWVAPA